MRSRRTACRIPRPGVGGLPDCRIPWPWPRSGDGWLPDCRIPWLGGGCWIARNVGMSDLADCRSVGWRGRETPCGQPVLSTKCRQAVDKMLKAVDSFCKRLVRGDLPLSITLRRAAPCCESCCKYTSGHTPLSRPRRIFSRFCRKIAAGPLPVPPFSPLWPVSAPRREENSSNLPVFSEYVLSLRIESTVSHRMDDGHSTTHSRRVVLQHDAAHLWCQARR